VASFENQARAYAPIDDDHAILVAQALEQNASDVPPMVVVRRKGKHKILGGNHRYYAALDILDMDTLPAYVITQDLSETQEIMLAITDNRRHGKPTSLDERVQQAAWLVRNRSMSKKDAAEAVGVPPKKVETRMARDEAISRLDNLGLGRERAKIPAHTQVRLTSIRDDEVTRAATRMIAETGMNSADASSFVTDLNRLRSTATQLAFVEKAGVEHRPLVDATAGGRVKVPAAISNVKAILSRIERIDLSEVTNAKTDPAIRTLLKQKASDGAMRLTELAAAL
jgi:hypothetical protein